MTTMELELELPEQSSDEWRSPLRKLTRFFLGSRDRWKSKYMAIKKRCKELGSQVRAVEKSREKWKQDAKHALQQVRQLQQELDDFKKSAA